jgi:hypothetical protein
MQSTLLQFSYHVRTKNKNKLLPIHWQLDRESKPPDFSLGGDPGKGS